MAEYICREELLEHLDKCRNDPIFDPDMAWMCLAISIFVENMKSADVQPVKRGKWMNVHEWCELNGCKPSGLGLYYWCSECNKSEEKKSDYCPNCGARMDLKGGNL